MRKVLTVLTAIFVQVFLGTVGMQVAGASSRPMPLGSPDYLEVGGHSFTLWVEKVVDHPVSEMPPGAGLRDIGVVVKVTDTSKAVIDVDLLAALAVINNHGAQYEADFDTLANCPGFSDAAAVNLGPRATESGCIAVGIPVASEPSDLDPQVTART